MQDPEFTVKTEHCCTKTLPVFVSSLGGPSAWRGLKKPDGEPSAAAVPDDIEFKPGASMHVFYAAPWAADKTVAFGVFSGIGGTETSAAVTVAQECATAASLYAAAQSLPP